MEKILETCIVCLGDLGENESDTPLPSAVALEGGQYTKSSDGIPPQDDSAVVSFPSEVRGADLIAHLLPCGHNLHDECLKPWVERANSCPICRQNFNQVELSTKIGGPIISSYPVIDRIQVADIDPSMLIEEYDDLESTPCPRCGTEDNEDVLMQCDGCDLWYHTYCVNLDSVPVDNWFCEDCVLNRTTEPTSDRVRSRSHNASSHRTLAQQRRARNHAQAASSSWARVWQSVWDHLNIDLDFPYHESPRSSQDLPNQSSISGRRRDYQAWERRFQVAERQGGTNHFRDAASTLLFDRDPFDRPTVSRPRPELPEPESVEEILAWNALEKARDIDNDPIPKTRKRKSATTSPSDADTSRRRKRRKSATTSPSDPIPAPRAERPLKRPQTRRITNVQEGSNEHFAESPTLRKSSGATQHTGHTMETAPQGNGPSFLQSLLKDVESSTGPEESDGQSRPLLTLSHLAASDHSSPRYSSPDASPTASNHPSPRASSATPPPIRSTRGGSPTPLTSRIEPIYPPPGFSPERSPPPEPSLTHRPNRASMPLSADFQRSRSSAQNASDSSRPRSQEASPTRANMSLSAKSDIQRLVKDALKLPYHNNEVSKDQYTEINRTISRMLYDKVGESSNLDGEAYEMWKQLANEEVSRAVQALHSTINS